MTKRHLLTLLAAASVLAAMAAPPAHAAPPDLTDEPVFLAGLDPDNTLVVFWNITRDDFCAWAAGGFAGPPPVVALVPAKAKPTGQGAIVAAFAATRPIELWNLDDPANPSDPCTDTIGQAGPWATGAARVVASDNDLDVSGTRTNSFGDRGRGTVTDGTGGRWSYSWRFRAQCRVDCELDFVVRSAKFTLRQV